MACTRLKTAKCVFIFINTLYAIGAIWFMVDMLVRQQSLTEDNSPLYVQDHHIYTAVICLAAVFQFIICVIGIWGAVKERTCFLYSYTWIMGIAFILFLLLTFIRIVQTEDMVPPNMNMYQWITSILNLGLQVTAIFLPIYMVPEIQKQKKQISDDPFVC